MADQNQNRARGRFFERLEQRVGGIAVQPFDLVDEDDAAAACRRRGMERRGRGPHGVDRDLGFDLAGPGIAFRLDHGSRSVVFATDNEIGSAESDARLHELARGADALVHDAQYTPEEYERFRGWGHSHWGQAIEAAEAAGVGRLVLFHHDPARSDDNLEAIVEKATARFPACEAAREGGYVEI